MNGDTPVEALAVRAMPIREVRDELKKRDVDMTGCLEKDDLVALLLANWRTALSHEELPSSPPAVGPTGSSCESASLASVGAGGSRSSPAPAAADPSSSGSLGSRGSCSPAASGSSESGQSRKKRMESQGYYICSHCFKKGKILHCGKCGAGGYCSKECQVAHWPEHKKVCKQLMDDNQRAKDAMGAGRVKALKTWADRNKDLLTFMAAATLWLPAPPRNTSHVLILDLHCEDSSPEARPKFAMQRYLVLTLEQMYEITAPTGGPGPLPEGPPDRMLILMICTSSSSGVANTAPDRPKNVLSLMKSVRLDPAVQSRLATGRLKLPPLAEIVAQLSQSS